MPTTRTTFLLLILLLCIVAVLCGTAVFCLHSGNLVAPPQTIADRSDKFSVLEWLKYNLNDPVVEEVKFWPARPMFQEREDRLADLKEKLADIKQQLADHEAHVKRLSDDPETQQEALAEAGNMRECEERIKELGDQIRSAVVATPENICRLKYRIKSHIDNGQILHDDLFIVQVDGKVRRCGVVEISRYKKYFE
jgi:hypothetical protein